MPVRPSARTLCFCLALAAATACDDPSSGAGVRSPDGQDPSLGPTPDVSVVASTSALIGGAAGCPWAVIPVLAGAPVRVDWSAAEVDVLGKPLPNIPPHEGNVTVVTYLDLETADVLAECGRVSWEDTDRVGVPSETEADLHVDVPAELLPGDGGVVKLVVAADGRSLPDVFVLPEANALPGVVSF